MKNERNIIIALYVIAGLLLLGVGNFVGFILGTTLRTILGVILLGSLFFVWKYYTNKDWARWFVILGVGLTAVFCFGFLIPSILLGIASNIIFGGVILIAATFLILKFL